MTIVIIYKVFSTTTSKFLSIYSRLIYVFLFKVFILYMQAFTYLDQRIYGYLEWEIWLFGLI